MPAAEGPPRRAYDHRSVEAKWQARWEAAGLHKADLGAARAPYYNLMMFPYPSAEGVHVGNVYAFTGSDIHGRFVAMKGYDVFEPMGFDAFGIHSENYALKVGEHPKRLTQRNVERFRETQLKRIGNRFDWSHEIQTTDPAYYRWSQWIFVRLYEGGLAERRRGRVNWCPSCKTVLADEQVIEGRCERCDAEVTKRELEQWYLKITRYAPQLLENLDRLDWSDVVKTAQRRWIGRSDGAEVEFAAETAGAAGGGAGVRVFTTRPDTLFGATFLVLAPEHPLVETLTAPERRAEVTAYVERAAVLSDVQRLARREEKSGVFTGGYVRNPANGERIPVFVADYVLMTYGTGAVMGVPAHDARDFAFARAHGAEIRTVVAPPGWDGAPPQGAYEGEGRLVGSGEFDGLPSAAAGRRITEWLASRGRGRAAVTFALRDWVISRQRYWGAPIPIVYCDACGAVPVPDEDLPVLLPDLEDYHPTGSGVSPLAAVPEFVNVTCPTCGGAARRETDVLDNFLDSAWFFLRYPSSEDNERAWNPDLTRKWLPVDMYIGGPEHSVLHLLYARFLCLALHDLGLLKSGEPFKTFRAHGIITKDGAKMSKSRGNVVNPDEYLDRYGADVLRLYLMFVGPFDQGGDFSDRSIVGVSRFLQRVAGLVERAAPTAPPGPVPAAPDDVEHAARRMLHRTIKRVTEDLGDLRYNTAIAAMMGYVSALGRRPHVTAGGIEALILLLAPFAPHFAEEMWQRIGGAFSVHSARWPRFDEAWAKGEKVQLSLQVNGRRRGVIDVDEDTPEEAVIRLALSSEPLQRHVAGKDVKRVIYVAGKVLNVVV